MSVAQRRLERFKSLIADIRRGGGLELGFRFWDGSTVPADLDPSALMIVIADEGVAASLLRRPNLETLAELWTARRIELCNGTLFDLASTPRTVKTRALARTIGWRRALFGLLGFAFVARGGPWPLRAMTDAWPPSGGQGSDIRYHYDVSNRFYALWLDREMNYTCGYCTDWSNDLDRMQRDKLDMICRKLRLKPGETLLDMGCGWAALTCHAAQHYGVTAYGVTLSEQQVSYANDKIARLGLADRVRVELKDYAEVEGRFDKVASIGLQEHVGFANHATYYATVHRVLKDDGLFLHHAGTRPAKRDQRTFRRGRAAYALLTKFVFPGGEFDYIGNTVTDLDRAGFEVHDVEAWRRHYQVTCRHWHDRLAANYDTAVAEVGETKARLWLTYLAASSIAFERSTVGVYQTLATKRRRVPPDLPPTRSDLYRSGEGDWPDGSNESLDQPPSR